MKRFVIVAVSLLTMIGFCDEAEMVKVRGRGTGTNKMEALKDAFRDAIEKAVGLYVDAEQMVKNEELVKDQILTQSNAYIEKYNVVIESRTPNGLTEVTILAEVRKLALAKKIKDIMPAQKVTLSNVSQNLHAEIVTDFKRKEESVALLKNELDNLSPVKQLMKVSLASEKPVTESIPEDTSLIRLWYPINVEVNRTRYYEEFVPRWTRILDQIKTAPVKRLTLKNELPLIKAYSVFVDKEYGTERKGKSGIMTRCEENMRDDDSWMFRKECYPLYKTGMALNEEYKGLCFLSTIVGGETYVLHGFGRSGDYNFTEKIDREAYRDAFGRKKRFVRRVFADGDRPLATIPEDCKFSVALVKSARGNMLSGSIYKIPYDCVSEIVNWQNKTVFGNSKLDSSDRAFKKTTYNLCFLDTNGEEVAGITFVLKNMDIANLACAILDEGESSSRTESRMWLITPLVGGVAKSYVKWVSVDVPKDDVAKIATASISVEE